MLAALSRPGSAEAPSAFVEPDLVLGLVWIEGERRAEQGFAPPDGPQEGVGGGLGLGARLGDRFGIVLRGRLSWHDGNAVHLFVGGGPYAHLSPTTKLELLAGFGAIAVPESTESSGLALSVRITHALGSHVGVALQSATVLTGDERDADWALEISVAVVLQLDHRPAP